MVFPLLVNVAGTVGLSRALAKSSHGTHVNSRNIGAVFRYAVPSSPQRVASRASLPQVKR